MFTVCFAIWTIFCAILGLPFGLSKKYAINLGKFWGHGTLFLLKIICKIEYPDENLDEISNKKNLLILSKHQSAWETIFLLVKIKNPVFVIKKELLSIPFYGWYLKNMGMIPVERSSKISEMKRMNDKIFASIRSGKSVILFPQGTRTPYGQNNFEFKYRLGCIDLVNKIPDLKIACIATNSGYFWNKTQKRPGKPSIKLCKIFENHNNIQELKDRIPKEIEDGSKKLILF